MKKPNWNRVVARLKRLAIAGDVTSIRDLGLTLAEGIQDRNGRCLVRCNLAYSARLLRRAAEMGDRCATGSLGYAYDVGRGIRRDRALALKWYRRAAHMGDSGAAANIATVFRDEGNLRHAHRWLLRAVKMGDGAAVTAGYGCRRHLNKRLLGHAECPEHSANGRYRRWEEDELPRSA